MGEQRTPEWHAARMGRVTASQIANVLMTTDNAGYQNYRAQLVCERLTGRVTEGYTSPAMQHGTDTEAQARAYYELVTGNVVQEVGFIPHPKLHAGASPDGLIGTDGGFEVKCPQPAQHLRTLTGAKIARNYMLQMQWGMACTGREWWDFSSFCPEFPDELQLHVQRVPADAEMIEEITEAVTRFLVDVDQVLADLQGRMAAA